MSKDGKFFLYVVIGAILVVAGIIFYSAKHPATQTVGNIDVTHGEKRGPDSAKVKIVEFGDLQCPACGAAEPKLRVAVANNPNDVQLIFRHFPLPMHANAPAAAKAAEAAANQGKFWEMHDILYDRQDEWSGLSDPTAQFLAYAKEIGLNTDQFTTDTKSDAVAQRIQDDMNYGDSLQVDETPTFYINGKKIAGGLTVEQWQQEIDAAKQQ